MYIADKFLLGNIHCYKNFIRLMIYVFTFKFVLYRWNYYLNLLFTFSLGLGFRPIAENADERSLVWYSASNATEVRKWTQLLDEFLERE